MTTPAPFKPPHRILLGPGPSNAAPSVLNALAQPLVGHLDPSFIRMMEEIKQMLEQVGFEPQLEVETQEDLIGRAIAGD